MATRILTVEDDERIRRSVKLALEDEGWSVDEAEHGEAALARFAEEAPDVVLIDVMLPGIDGFELCRRIRRQSDVPIVMVTARGDTHDVVAGLEAGADDYVTKPVNAKELAARIRAALRRTQLLAAQEAGSVRRVGEVEMDDALGVVRRAGRELALTRTEYLLLREFFDHPNAVLSRDQLLERVWGYDYLGDSRLVDAHVRRLRLKVEDVPEEPRLVVTVRGLGYRLIAG